MSLLGTGIVMDINQKAYKVFVETLCGLLKWQFLEKTCRFDDCNSTIIKLKVELCKFSSLFPWQPIVVEKEMINKWRQNNLQKQNQYSTFLRNTIQTKEQKKFILFIFR